LIRWRRARLPADGSAAVPIFANGYSAQLSIYSPREDLPRQLSRTLTESADVGKGTFFNYFPSKDHILLAFVEMQLGKLESAIETARQANEPMPEFLRSLGIRMTQEPTRNPAIVRALLQAYLSTTPVREAMMDLQKRMHGLHTQMIQLGQDRGEIRNDLPAAEIAHVFRQTIFGTLLIWSLYGDATLHSRIETALTCSGRAWRLAPIRRLCRQPRYSPVETSFMNRKLILISLVAAVALAATGSMPDVSARQRLQGSGTVESRNIRVGSKIGGRIVKS